MAQYGKKKFGTKQILIIAGAFLVGLMVGDKFNFLDKIPVVGKYFM